MFTNPEHPRDAHFIIQKSNSVSSCLPPAEPVNSLVLSDKMPIHWTYERKWCGPGPSQAILSPLLGLKQNWKITPLALTVHLNHFNTIIIMRLSNIIFKSLGEGKKKKFHFLCLTILNWERVSERRRKWYLMRQGKKVIKSHLYPPSRTHTHTHTHTHTRTSSSPTTLALSHTSVCLLHLCALQPHHVTWEKALRNKHGRQLILIVKLCDC